MAKFVAHGTTVTVDSVDVGGVVSAGLPDESRGEAEATDSDSGGSREYLPGLRDPGSTPLLVLFDMNDAGQQYLRDNYEAAGGCANQLMEVVYTLPPCAGDESGQVATITFDAYVSNRGGNELNMTDDTVADYAFQLRVSGDVVYAITSV